MIDGVLVVKVDYVDVAYLFMRQYLIAKLRLEREYQSKVSQLQVSEQVMQELRDSVNNGDLDGIIISVPHDVDAIDELVNNAVEYIRTLSGKVKKKTDHIRAQVTKLMSNHIGVMRAKLAGDPTS
jgi:transcription termination factor NusB